MNNEHLKIYLSYWLSSNIRICSYELKGIFIEILLILYGSTERGLIRWPLNKLAKAVNATVDQLNELIDNEILIGADTAGIVSPLIYTPKSGGKYGKPVILIPKQHGPAIYWPTMVIDEYKRQNSGVNAQRKNKLQSTDQVNQDTHQGIERVLPKKTLSNCVEVIGDVVDNTPEKSIGSGSGIAFKPVSDLSLVMARLRLRLA
jgi:hypothetical protein